MYLTLLVQADINPNYRQNLVEWFEKKDRNYYNYYKSIVCDGVNGLFI